jgi:hypothetical protein
MINSEVAIVIEYSEININNLLKKSKLCGEFMEIWSKKPNSIPEKVVKIALSFKIVS